MATDYDAPRVPEEDPAADALEGFTATGNDKAASVLEEDETDLANGYELPGADLSGEELLVQILPPQPDEFTCASCFLVHHRSQLARESGGRKFCTECEG